MTEGLNNNSEKHLPSSLTESPSVKAALPSSLTESPSVKAAVSKAFESAFWYLTLK